MPTPILIVDDRALNREFLTILLECTGYQVFNARDGAEALDILQREEIALVISDIMMPIMDGIEFVKRMHAIPALADIPVIFYTATYRASEARAIAQQSSVAMVLAKPAEPQTIIEAVATVLDKAAAHAMIVQADVTRPTPFLRELAGLQYRLQAALNTLPDSLPEGGVLQNAGQAARYTPGNIQSLSLRTAALLELSMSLSLEREPQPLLDLFCRATRDIMNVEFTAVGMRDDIPRRYAQRGMSAEEVEMIFDALYTPTGVLHGALSQGLPIHTASADYPMLWQLPEGHPLRRNALLIPVVLRSRAYGWLYVAEKCGIGTFHEEDEQFAVTLAAQLGPSYENIVLYDEARQRAGELELKNRRIEKLSRLYAVLSGINSAIVRIRDRTELFQEACRVAVDDGDFSMAWVGVIDPGTLEGEVVAWCGKEVCCVDDIHFTARAGTPYGDRPSCVAVREKRPVICNNTQQEGDLEPIHAQLLESGHHSLAAWPLMRDNQVVAVLALFASEVDFFNEEQTKLLNELAGDLSFGLQFIDREEGEARLTRRLTNTLESITDSFIMLDRNWKFTYLNNDAERLLSCSRKDMLGKNIWERFPEAVNTRYYVEYHRAVEQNCSVSFEEYYEPLDLWTEIRAYPSEEGLAIYFADISARKAAEAEIHELAFFDKLTGLPNRQLLRNRLEQAIAASKRTGRPGAALFIDLDNFKSINDTAGHDKGDILLQQVAQRIKGVVRTGDTVARGGGDEYVILLEDVGDTTDDTAAYAKHVAEQVMTCFHAPFEIADLLQYSACSIGVALFDQQTAGVDEVLKCADLAMYQAKSAGRNTMSFFSPDMQARITMRVALEADLRNALKQQEFLLHYQPQIDFHGDLIGVEALVRWDNPVRGMVSPAAFVPIAEDTGLILPLGMWVMKAACTLLKKWQGRASTERLTMAVNVSAFQFHRPDFVEQVLRTLRETGANPNRLKLELTESLLVDDIEGTIFKMNALRKFGVLFSLDDFGTGYSSLSYLHRLPLDQLKIDQSFIRDALNDENAAVIVRSVLALGKALNLGVIAEGVETVAHHGFIKEEGCREYQGYLFSKPLPEAKLEQYMEQHFIHPDAHNHLIPG